jgi:hypothetical protein
MLKLAALLESALNASSTRPRDIGSQLRLSSLETRALGGALAGAAHPLWDAQNDPGPLDMHRYYRVTGASGVSGVILRLAMEYKGAPIRGASGGIVAARAEKLLEAWFDRGESIVEPPRIVNGDEVMRLVGAERGPRVGAILDRLREAQVQGLVVTREQALTYVAELRGDPTSQLEGDDRR